jgi:hypothetical protein
LQLALSLWPKAKSQKPKAKSQKPKAKSQKRTSMAFPVKSCVVCGEEFELKPGKPGFANRCPDCSEPDDAQPGSERSLDAGDSEMNAERRRAMRDLLYRKDS